jgi:M6 family metalloprotease-like protein
MNVGGAKSPRRATLPHPLLRVVSALILSSLASASVQSMARARPHCFGLDATVTGTGGADRLRGTSGADVIAALGGDDVVFGLGGRDVICGGPGDDILSGGGGSDRLDGGPGINSCRAGEQLLSCRGPDRRPPQLIRATARGAHVEALFDEPLMPLSPRSEPLQPRLNGRPIRVTRARAVGRRMDFDLAEKPYSDDLLSVTAGEHSFEIRDVFGNIADPRPRIVKHASPRGCTPFLPFVVGSDYGVASVPTDERFLQPRGKAAAVVLFVDFPDAPAEETTDRAAKLFAETLSRWYSEISYGGFELSVTAVPRWYRLARNARDWELRRGGSAIRYQEYFAAAVAAADPDVDFSKFEILYVIAAPRAAGIVGLGAAFNGRRGSTLPTADGNAIGYASASTLDALPDSRALSFHLVHETGHFLGLPDLYDFAARGYVSQFVHAGAWDTMSMFNVGAGLLAWQRWKLGWLDPDQLRCVTRGTLEISLSPLARPGGHKAVVVPAGSTSALVIESRQRLGFDSALCGAGILVYRVDSSTRSGAGPIRVLPAAADPDPERQASCGPMYNGALGESPGQASSLIDSVTSTRVDVLGEDASGVRVRVSRP